MRTGTMNIDVWAAENEIGVTRPKVEHGAHSNTDYASAYSFEHSPCIDFGKFICRVPDAVLSPSTEDEVARCLSFLQEEGLPFVVRGSGHSSGGQSLIEAGVVLELSRNSGIREDIGDGALRVGAATSWMDVIRYLAHRGRRPLVTTSNWWTTVGGTLGVGGFGECSHLLGMQADHVSRATIATLDGQIRPVASGDELFDYSLASCGVLGVMTDATIQTVEGSWRLAARTLRWPALIDFLNGHQTWCNAGSYASLRARIQWESSNLKF